MEVIPYSQNSQDRILISNIKSAKQLKQLNEQQPDKSIISSCLYKSYQMSRAIPIISHKIYLFLGTPTALVAPISHHALTHVCTGQVREPASDFALAMSSTGDLCFLHHVQL